jgi:very-short-patch-repair endonuclease
MNRTDHAVLLRFEEQHGVISRRQALAAGLSDRTIENRLASGLWARMFRGTYRLAGMPRTQEQTYAAARLAAGDDALVSHRSAAYLFGLPGLARWAEVTVPHPRTVAVAGITVHRARRLSGEDGDVMKGIPVTSAARTLIDLASCVEARGLEHLLDHALAFHLVTKAGLAARMEGLGRAGRKGAGALAALLDERPEKGRPMGAEFEARLFRALKRAALPLPVPQFRLVLAGDERFLDFAYPGIRLAIEADSYISHATREAWEKDRERNNELVTLGWSFLPMTWDTVRYRPAEAARQVGASLATRR